MKQFPSPTLGLPDPNEMRTQEEAKRCATVNHTITSTLKKDHASNKRKRGQHLTHLVLGDELDQQVKDHIKAIKFPKEFNVTDSAFHWSTTETMLEYVDKVLVPHKDRICEEMYLPVRQKALVFLMSTICPSV